MGDSASDQGQDTNEFATDAELDQIAKDAAQIANDRNTGREDTTDSLTARDLQQIEDRASGRSANTRSFTEQSQNYVDDFSGANRGSLPTARSPFTASLPSTFGTDYTKDYSDFNFANSNAAQGLRDNTNLTGGMFPLVDALTGLPSRMTLNALNRGQVPTFTGGNITGTTGQGFGMASGPGNPNPFGPVEGYDRFAPVTPTTNVPMDMGDDGGGNEQTLIRRNPNDPVNEIVEERPPVSDDLAVNYLQDPFYLYSGQGNLFQPYGYAQNTLVDLLRTRNLTQPQQAAANLGLFGNPGDFV